MPWPYGYRHGLHGPYRFRAQYGPDRHPPVVLGNALQRLGQACRCFERRAVPLTDCQRVAFVSLAFNVRNKAFCRSTLVRKTNPGDIDGVCAELSRWTNAARLGGSWVLNGWRAGVRIACAESFHSKQVQAQTPKAQAATEIKWQQCRITFSLNRKNTHDDTKRLAALESGQRC